MLRLFLTKGKMEETYCYVLNEWISHGTSRSETDINKEMLIQNRERYGEGYRRYRLL